MNRTDSTRPVLEDEPLDWEKITKAHVRKNLEQYIAGARNVPASEHLGALFRHVCAHVKADGKYEAELDSESGLPHLAHAVARALILGGFEDLLLRTVTTARTDSTRPALEDEPQEPAVKTRWELMPWDAIEAVAGVFTFGAAKYSDHGWRNVPASEHLGALFRHLYAHVRAKGKYEAQLDKESGLPHLAHAAARVLMLMEVEI